MATENNKPQFSFRKPAVYKIVVQGDLSERFSDRLAGMQISVDRSNTDETFSVLIGQINDQPALLGILNTLNDYHLTLKSVKTLNE
jgi:hypothetical protein